MKLAIFLKVAYFLTVLLSFLFINKTLRLSSLKARTAMNAKVSLFVICAEVSIYLLSHNLHDCTFNNFCFTYQITPEVVARKCSVKKLFVEFLQKSQEFYRFYVQKILCTEAVVHRCSSKQVLKNFAKFTGKHLCQSLFK